MDLRSLILPHLSDAVLPIFLIRNDGVGGSNPSCGTTQTSHNKEQLGVPPFRPVETGSGLVAIWRPRFWAPTRHPAAGSTPTQMDARQNVAARRHDPIVFEARDGNAHEPVVRRHR